MSEKSRGVTIMINLNEYQTIFNHDITYERCRRVLDQIEVALKPIVQQFMDSFNDPSLYLQTYGVTLTTTYHDALNPNYAEQRKESNIGRKYFIRIMKKVGDSEVNALTLEFNGMEKQILLSVETNFYPIWEAVRLNRINGFVNKLNADVDVLVSSQSKVSTIRELVQRQELEDFIKSCIKPRKRPWMYFAKRFPLEGEWSNEKLFDELKEAWDYLEPVRNYLEEEEGISVQAAHILTLLQTEDAKQGITLFQRSYQLQYGSLEKVKAGVCRQQFSLKDQEQLIVKGYVVYYQFHEKQSPYQVLAIQLDGHNHIYTNVRYLLGTEKKAWWIRKLFATQSLNNAEVLETGMNLLKQHGLQIKESEYLAGTYDNASETFTEEADIVKKRLITAALLFAHASEKLHLPTVDDMELIKDEGDEQSGELEEEEYTASFQLTSILELIANSSFTFAKEIIRDLHLNLTSLDDKHFVILSGISGTGKTQLARLYANAVYGLEYEADNPYMSVIPVRPDWTDSSSLFGYYSSFENRYVIPEFLRMVQKAHQEREKPHFVVFDEMNLARVEYYLSDYLSGVESRKEILLHNRVDLIDIPKTVTIPPNLYVIGTVNVDETTHSISDKVLDRAFLMTLSEVDFDTFWNKSAEGVRFKLQMEFDFLKQVHDILKPYYLHFGYRSMNEMLQKLSHNKDLEANIQMDDTEALEKVIIEKVLPKVRGDDSISEMLAKLHPVFEAKFGSNSAAVGIVERMKKEIARYGAAQFWR
ncbi:McrB family protein [Paenibacillus eucommiae]|uniref:MoxR-like ATPase n=1 Tax=Paenibacillus eucommiae TaxID=1355755 RepID=A0ABS4J7M5_9BACL|nr:AAA family ATPase [Paenibacillus eucommiae]MBP1995823.1 MoxR-like ATPase [Paenibacillus eucommiae]